MKDILKYLTEIIYYYQSIIGAFLGSSLAGLIAYYSIRRTQKNQIDLENEKIKVERYQEEKVYCGYLYSVWAIMQGHQSFLTGLRRELNFILKDFESLGKIAYDKPFNVLPVDLLKESYFKVLGYEKYNSKIVNKLVSYLGVMDSLTNELNFITIKKLKEEIADKKDYAKRVEFYFSQVFGHLDILLETAQIIGNDIMTDLSNSKTSNIFYEGAKSIKDKANQEEPATN